jgi:adenine-specific DNA methylase
MFRMTPKKKLIEVTLRRDAINAASVREKAIRRGHPSTLHPWRALRPLAAARAVIFAQMVDDRSAHPDLFPTEKKQVKEHQRLFKIIEDRHSLRRPWPFQREPDRAVTSVNCDFAELLTRAEAQG